LVEDPAVRERRVLFLSALSPSRREGDVLDVHGSRQSPLRGNVLPEDVYNGRKMRDIGTRFDRVCFTGNTGVPGVFIERGPGRWDCVGAEECVGGFRVAGRRVHCDVGAVGYPRDGDCRACYALFDGETIRFRRVEHDVEATIRKIHSISMRGSFFGERLREGRA
jgi:diadenosine tetraphosphatase ApaH/serine/threonine PP2A family protein phosphatase